MSEISDHFDLIPNELILKIALYLSLDNVINLCLTNSKFNKAIFS
jgi:hypothetical protein